MARILLKRIGVLHGTAGYFNYAAEVVARILAPPDARYGDEGLRISAASPIYVPPQRIGFRPLSVAEAARASTMAERAIKAFDLSGYVVGGLTKHSNTTARLTSRTGPPLALRLRTGPSVDGNTEFSWLQAVRSGTDLRVVEPFADSFALNTRVIENDYQTTTECALFRWASGEPLAAHLTAVNYHELGTISARLHAFSSTWTPPAGLHPLVWDRTLYYEGTSLAIADPRYEHLISRKQARTVEAVLRAADDELRELAESPDRMFLHGNIEMWNVLVTAPGELRLLDFEDVMFGAPALDVAVTLYYGRERPDFASLSEAFEAGYRSVRDWPLRNDRQMTLLVAARAAMLLNHGLLTEPDARSVTKRLLPLILAAAL